MLFCCFLTINKQTKKHFLFSPGVSSMRWLYSFLTGLQPPATYLPQGSGDPGWPGYWLYQAGNTQRLQGKE